MAVAKPLFSCAESKWRLLPHVPRASPSVLSSLSAPRLCSFS
uniref:Uncharacterized protein n=1 Tax=Anguilla anguilla TaxID=7936 RepID=A0A0E9PMM0_ANGAN